MTAAGESPGVDQAWADTGYRTDPTHSWVAAALQIVCPLRTCAAQPHVRCITDTAALVHYARVARAQDHSPTQKDSDRA